MRKSTRWNRSEPSALDQMVMEPFLPYLGDKGVRSANNNPSPSHSKVDTGVSFKEPKYQRINFADPQALAIWNFFRNADDPSHVAQIYRNYRDSKYCTLPKEHLRRMRDIMVSDMREHEKNSHKPRKQTQVGRNAPSWNSSDFHIRRGA